MSVAKTLQLEISQTLFKQAFCKLFVMVWISWSVTVCMPISLMVLKIMTVYNVNVIIILSVVNISMISGLE